MSPGLTAHLACLALVAVDMTARATRARWYLRGLGQDVAFRTALEYNLWGEAAAALTPMRLGGEPARVVGMKRAGVPLGIGVAASATEGVLSWLAVALLAGVLVSGFAPLWWHEAGPRLAQHAATAWPWLVGVLVLLTVAGALLRRRRHRRPGSPGGRLRALFKIWLGMSRWSLVAGLLLSLISVGARTLVLPALTMGITGHPPLAVLWIGSFLLVYSQTVLPTPGGAGAVELAFLGGVAGDLGSGETGLLLAWRGYSIGLGTVLGLALALHRFGARPLLQLLRGRLPATPDLR